MERPAKTNQNFEAQVLQNLRALVRGNGAKPEALNFENFAAETIILKARTTLTPRTKTERFVRPGKVGSDVVHAPHLILPALEAKLQHMLAAPETRMNILNTVLARVDKGFQPGADFVLNLSAYKAQMAAYEGCTRCHHTGRNTCAVCQGAREITCTRCAGSRTIPCTVCKGSRQLQTPQGPKPCTQCGATGRLVCPMCQQRGRVPCEGCGAQGSLACTPCGATGWTSVVITGQLEATGHFEFLESNKAPEMLDAVQKTGAKAVLSHEWHIAPQIAPDLFAVDYTVQTDYAHFTFHIGKMQVQAKALGKSGRIANAPPFLEKLLHRPLRLLLDAAASKKEIQAALAAIARYRLLREALLLGTKTSPAKVVAKLRHLYPAGIRAGTLAKITEATDILLRAGTEKARLQGMAAGVALASLFFAAVKFSSLEYMLIPVGAPSAAHFIWLAGVGAIGLLILRLTIQFFGRYALRQLMRGIFRPEQLRFMLPPSGRLFYMGTALCLGVLLVMEMI